MGIRYYAYPVDADLIDAAKACPRDFLGEDPLMDAWGPDDERPRMLYLDKCWRELQLLFKGDGMRPDRPSIRLVSGNVRETGMGWIPHIAVLDPTEVSEIATDLATVTSSEVRSMFAANPHLEERHGADEEFAYVTQYLRDALTFTSELSDLGLGLVYMIG